MHTHLSAQYKVLVTPTMHIFEHANYEESNHMLRMHGDNHFNFIKVAVCNDQSDSIFVHAKAKPLLDYIGKIISD